MPMLDTETYAGAGAASNEGRTERVNDFDTPGFVI